MSLRHTLAKLKGSLFENKSTRQTIAKNIFWLSISQLASRFIRAVIIIYAARALGASEYGVFSYALGLASFFTIFADIGVNNILTREVSQKPEMKDTYFSTSFWLKMGLLWLTTLLLIFVAPHFSHIEEAVAIIPLVALITVFDNIREFAAAFFRAKEKMELEALVVFITNTGITAFGFAILAIAKTAKALAFSYMASTALGSIIALWFLRNELKKVFVLFEKKLLKPILQAAWPIALAGIFGAFMLNIDVIMLGVFKTAKEVGFYSAGQKIIQVFYTLPTIIGSSTFPKISAFIGRGEHHKITLIMEKSITVLFLIAIPAMVGGIILAGPIIHLIYGAEYAPAAPAFAILLLSLPLVFAGSVLVNLILGYNKQKSITFFVLVSSIANVILTVVLIPLFGVIGAALATIGVQILFNTLNWYASKKIIPFFTFRHMKKIFTAAFGMGLVSLLIKTLGISVVINIIVSAAVYFGLLYILKEPIVEDVRSLLYSKETKEA